MAILSVRAFAVPVQVSYGSITASTTEDFESSFPLSGNNLNFNGFTASSTTTLFVTNNSSNFCAPGGMGVDNCLSAVSTAEPRVLNGFNPGTTQVGFDLTPHVSPTIAVTVQGNSGSSVFNLLSGATYGFSDVTGLLSITLTGASTNYAIDDVITAGAAVVPLPAALPLLGGGLGLLGLLGRRRKRATAA